MKCTQNYAAFHCRRWLLVKNKIISDFTCGPRTTAIKHSYTHIANKNFLRIFTVCLRAVCIYIYLYPHYPFYFMLQTNSNTSQSFNLRSVFIHIRFIFSNFPILKTYVLIDPIAEMKCHLHTVHCRRRRTVKVCIVSTHTQTHGDHFTQYQFFLFTFKMKETINE